MKKNWIYHVDVDELGLGLNWVSLDEQVKLNENFNLDENIFG